MRFTPSPPKSVAHWLLLLCLAFGIAACDSDTPFDIQTVDFSSDFDPAIDLDAMQQTTSGAYYDVLTEGAGEPLAVGDYFLAHYTLWLSDGTLVEATEGEDSFQFALGEQILGFIEGVEGMVEGEVRRVVVPPNLGYGSNGNGSLIPGNAVLVFDVELVEVGFDMQRVEFSSEFDPPIDLETMEERPSGLFMETLVPGSGSVAVAEGDEVTVQYTGWLPNRTEFDSGEFSFTVEDGGAILGFIEGVVGMVEGETRRLVIPPNLGYGGQTNGVIPPHSVLVFELEVTEIVPSPE